MAGSLVLCAYAIRDISFNRTQTIRRDCEDQNARNRNTVGELDLLSARNMRRATAVERRQVVASRSFAILLIDKLAPVQDCQSLVKLDTTH
ncbi:MAG: hypothetical protein JO130_18665 [Solirubrobacterales bacterium]|nr:hypothetical protein [Solirubrobacterales bacterium]